MTSFSHFSVNSRPYSYLDSLSIELYFDKKKNYLFDLSYMGLINIDGERALDFLQGQFTTDVREVKQTLMRPGALCNLQGRILALADILQNTASQYSLTLPLDLVSKTLSSLEKVALLSRVKISPLTDVKILGFYLQNPQDISPNHLPLPSEQYAVAQSPNLTCYAIAEQLYLILVPKEHLPNLQHEFIEHHQFRGSLAWHLLKLQHNLVEIYPESRSLFLPHRLSLHLNPTISFNKGCYKGQEIIARTQYRAKLKHTFRNFIIKTPNTLRSGLALYAQNGKQEVGEIIDYSPLGENQSLISTSIYIEYPKMVYLQENSDPINLDEVL
jgi:folate-binding protein YgfZ